LITIAGYPYPILAGPSGQAWEFDLNDIDTSSGDPIVRTRNGYWVYGRGCTEPGGGIVPGWGFVRTAPIGFGQEEILAPVVAASASPWTLAIATTVLGAATGWVIEEIARNVRGRRRR
jgi:hypothetical protein